MEWNVWVLETEMSDVQKSGPKMFEHESDNILNISVWLQISRGELSEIFDFAFF